MSTFHTYFSIQKSASNKTKMTQIETGQSKLPKLFQHNATSRGKKITRIAPPFCPSQKRKALKICTHKNTVENQTSENKYHVSYPGSVTIRVFAPFSMSCQIFAPPGLTIGCQYWKDPASNYAKSRLVQLSDVENISKCLRYL